MNDDIRRRLLDDHWSLRLKAGGKAIAFEDARLVPPVLSEMARASAFVRRFRGTASITEWLDLGPRHASGSGQAEIDELDRRVIELEGIGARMGDMEVGEDSVHAETIQHDRDRYPVFLAKIA